MSVVFNEAIHRLFERLNCEFNLQLLTNTCSPQTVTYIAGAGIGFQPTGDDIHPDVSAAVELNLKNPPQEKDPKKL